MKKITVFQQDDDPNAFKRTECTMNVSKSLQYAIDAFVHSTVLFVTTLKFKIPPVHVPADSGINDGSVLRSNIAVGILLTDNRIGFQKQVGFQLVRQQKRSISHFGRYAPTQF